MPVDPKHATRKDTSELRLAENYLQRPLHTLGTSMSQIFLVSNPWTGLLIIIGIAVASVPMASLVCLGAVMTTLVAHMFRDVSLRAIYQGLAGYNGALIGAASYIIWGEYKSALATTILGGFAGACVTRICHWFVTRSATQRWELPILTAPFCITAGIIDLLGAQHVISTPLDQFHAQNAWVEFFRSVLGNISEVVVISNPMTGAFILMGLFIASWRVGLVALLGAMAEFAMELLFVQDINKLAHGLLGYSGVLVAIALGVCFIHGSWLRRMSAAGIGLVLSEIMARSMTHITIPTYTWPFIVPTWAVIVLMWLIDQYIWPTLRVHNEPQS